MRPCNACAKHINISEQLECTKCKANFHYQCVGIDSEHYTRNRQDLELSWICPDCIRVTKRPKRDDTPISNRYSAQYETKNNKSTDEVSPCPSETPQIIDLSTENIEQISITISSILDSKLDNLVKSFRQDIANEFEKRIDKIRKEYTTKFDNITTEQGALERKITKLSEKISTLEIELKEMRQHISTQRKTSAPTPPETVTQLKQEVTSLQEKIYKETNNRKIILYGLDEHWNELSHQIIERINYAFYDLLSIDINGYIDSVRRIGKKGNRRPIEIEFISKRMTDYILDNARNFRNSGLYVSKIMTRSELDELKILKQKLQESRRIGHHAVIRQNKLYINGKLYQVDTEALNLNQQPKTLNLEHRNDRRETQETSTPQTNRTFRN